VIKVLVVDDSALVRRILSDALNAYEDIEVVGSAVDPYAARDKIVKLQPDVLTLDIEMPRMDGISFLAKLMKFHPMPVIIVSSVAPENSETALQALRLGAVDVVSKPGSQFSTPDVSRKLVRSIRGAATAVLRQPVAQPASQAREVVSISTTNKILALGASTGGTQAIESVLRRLPADSPGMVVVQHMPKDFTEQFARSLDRVSQMSVKEAEEGDAVVTGRVLIAPGGQHMVLAKDGARYVVKLKGGPQVHFQRPAVDVLFQSVATEAGANAVGMLLTGMGSDGGKGMLAMRQAGAHCIAQDEKSCIVYGMPRVAVELGAVDEVLPLDKIPSAISRALSATASPVSP
jgi:two-component system, chemotaxis family, protein-glutamate methylesterase/glutaminase